ncbi:MAG: cytosol nonspecific dipeptidase [Crocinitomicaceae bacterium]|nr:cytosol nonspecific dipeptidase [Crocinitomicaceae bacterium]|tara:strand:- start:331 stop:1794 length:1464 start_codon:yes stop_codon:yes gene_type:complete
MSAEVRNLEPKVIWNHFADLNEVPRGSKKEERVQQFMMDFGNKLGLETIKDEIGNVLIKKPATPGMENKKGVVLQGHLDMVHQKNGATQFDFDTEGIKMYIDGDWVKADGTTLGADNGLGVAAAMAVLSSDNLEHGPIEALFTADEETGMTGANNLEPGWLKGDILLNMDTEDEGELCIGCAGGIDTSANYNYSEEPIPENYITCSLNIKGLFGGHSGCDIHLQKGNSNKLLSRFLVLANENFDIRLISFNGGSLRNAIPREVVSLVSVDEANYSALEALVSEFEGVIKGEFKNTDPDLYIEFSRSESAGKHVTKEDNMKMINALNAAPNGVYRMSSDFDGLVETSTNLSRVQIENGRMTVDFLTRSSIEEPKIDLKNQIDSLFKLIGAEVTHGGSYPGWTPNPDSDILKTMRVIHEEFFGEKPEVSAIHAGLECGIIARTQPQLDMISFGPTIKNAHSPDEMANIPTTERFWGYLQKILKDIPNKN